jgi:hypothetical protein
VYRSGERCCSRRGAKVGDIFYFLQQFAQNVSWSRSVCCLAKIGMIDVPVQAQGPDPDVLLHLMHYVGYYDITVHTVGLLVLGQGHGHGHGSLVFSNLVAIFSDIFIRHNREQTSQNQNTEEPPNIPLGRRPRPTVLVARSW